MSLRHGVPILGLIALMSGCSSPSTPASLSTHTFAAGSWMNLPNGRTTLDGEELRNKVVFVEFWATW
jgi:hypothetical protein